MRHFLKLHLYGVPSYMIPQKHHLTLQIVVYLFEFRVIFGTRKICSLSLVFSVFLMNLLLTKVEHEDLARRYLFTLVSG